MPFCSQHLVSHFACGHEHTVRAFAIEALLKLLAAMEEVKLHMEAGIKYLLVASCTHFLFPAMPDICPYGKDFLGALW